MPLITRQFGPSPKGSILSFEDMDNNLIYLEELTKLDLIPLTDNVYTLGTTSSRWKSINVGPGTITITDQTLNTPADISVDNGVLQINGANQLQVGQLKFVDNTIESTSGATDIQIGLTSSTADLKINRNVVLAPDKTFGLVDTVTLDVAELSVTDGVLNIDGANQLQVGQLKFVDNTIESTTGAIDIQIGLTSSTADLKLNRDVVLAPGKTFTFGDGTTQSTAAGIIQQYTPTSSADSYGVTGSLVRDNENIYVRTNGYGWRPIPFNNSYGSFYDTTNQANTPASTARAININSTATASGVSIVSGNRITVDHDGIYNIQFSLQLTKSDSSNDDADIWLRYNGVDVPHSNGIVTLIGNGGKCIASWNFVQTMTASSYCQIYWSSGDSNLTIYAVGTQTGPTRPATPSIIVTVDKISSLIKI